MRDWLPRANNCNAFSTSQVAHFQVGDIKHASGLSCVAPTLSWCCNGVFGEGQLLCQSAASACLADCAAEHVQQLLPIFLQISQHRLPMMLWGCVIAFVLATWWWLYWNGTSLCSSQSTVYKHAYVCNSFLLPGVLVL